MKLTAFAASALLAMTALATTARADGPVAYEIDTVHSGITFDIEHMGLNSVPGRFKEFSGNISFDESAPENSTASVTIKVASIDTNNVKRDEHLQKDDFFDAAKYPNITFETTKIEKKPGGYSATGKLTVKDVTKDITFPLQFKGKIKDPRSGGNKIGFKATFPIQRKEHGITYDRKLPTGTPALGEEVIVTLNIQANETR